MTEPSVRDGGSGESLPAGRRRRARFAAWILGLGGVFVASIVSGLAGRLVDIGTAGASPTSSVESLTDVRYVRPFDNAGRLLAPYVAVKSSLSGQCQRGYESSDPSALRCFDSSDQVFDPCWLGGLDEAVCLANPWTPAATLIHNPVVAAFTPGPIGPTPWALELSDPNHPDQVLRCAFAGGTAGTVAGMRINYGCFNGAPAPSTYVGDAVGEPHPSDTRPWTIDYVPKGSSDVGTTTVRRVYH